jgi:hypothetical protein
MSDARKRIVRCPYDEATQFLTAFIAQHRTGDGSARIALRLPAGIFAERRSLVERRLCATLYPLHSMNDRQQIYSVTWTLPAFGAWPEYSGALAVEKGAHDDCFGIFVSGDYEQLPCTGSGGGDAMLLRRIAQASARELLRTIAGYVENACAHSFAARAGNSKPLQYAAFSTRSTDSGVLTS